MAELKYRFNPDTLNFERIRVSGWQKAKRTMLALLPGLLVGIAGMFLLAQFVDTSAEAQLKRENQQLAVQYELVNKRLSEIETVLYDVQRRDDNVYRVIFEADPIPASVRQAGIGGVNRYKDLDGYASSELVKTTRERLDGIAKRLYVQSLSLDEVAGLAMRKQEMLASIPSIQPIAMEKTQVSSGFGERMHPILKIIKMHQGLDFTSPVGTEVYASGNGRVAFADYSTGGYGVHVVIDHGFGYETLYAHLSRLKVRPGQKVERGELIGWSGNTGLSSAPHLHYEVHRSGDAVDPSNYLFNSLTPEEYARLIEQSRNASQSFD